MSVEVIKMAENWGFPLFFMLVIVPIGGKLDFYIKYSVGEFAEIGFIVGFCVVVNLARKNALQAAIFQGKPKAADSAE